MRLRDGGGHKGKLQLAEQAVHAGQHRAEAAGGGGRAFGEEADGAGSASRGTARKERAVKAGSAAAKLTV